MDMAKFWVRQASARLGTLTTWAAYRQAVKRQRCPFPAERLFEWQELDPMAVWPKVQHSLRRARIEFEFLQPFPLQSAIVLPEFRV